MSNEFPRVEYTGRLKGFFDRNPTRFENPPPDPDKLWRPDHNGEMQTLAWFQSRRYYVCPRHPRQGVWLLHEVRPMGGLGKLIESFPHCTTKDCVVQRTASNRATEDEY